MPSNAEVAERFLRAWASGDIDSARSLCHDDLHFQGPIEEWHTAAEHLESLRGVASVVERVDVQRVVADGDDVIVVYDLVTRTPVGTARIAEWKTLRDGKIASIRAYFDSHPWREAGFGGPAPVQLLREFYEAVVQRDLVTARRYLSDDLVFVGVFETYRGPQPYLEALAQLLNATLRLDVRAVIGQGSETAVFFELETGPPIAGTALVAEWHQFKDGKIVHVESAFDARPYAAMFAGGTQ